ncbi:usherin-like [Poeciliopsis prolifica]|uniref:usherin-like n=1 Tax=Poeciliopsis prolifica TaxID=188132 RepID=UPI0024130610|nr:usherin-like [Poeciliopsis prolifica]
MISVNRLRLVLLVCGFFTFWDPVKTRTHEKGSTTTGWGFPLQLVCGGKPYNPQKDTCCKPHENGKGNLTKGLSERMSQCCGEVAYNPLNEICCNRTVKPKPSHDAKCCGEVPYDKKKNICCTGKVLENRSPDHLCCYGKLFDSSIENCCQFVFPRIQLKINNSNVCEKNLTCDPTFSGNNHCKNFSADNQTNEINKSDEQVCEDGNEKEVYHKKEGFECCGHYYFNHTLWSCEKRKLHGKIQNDTNLLFQPD